jgi:hypothetical protein
MKPGTATFLLFGLMLFTVTWCAVHAQPKAVKIGAASDFSTSIYDPTNQAKLLANITAAEAEPQAEGQFRLKKLKIESFGDSGERELIVEAPDCIYDSSKQTASSPGALHVQSGSGTMTLEGEGFLWEQKVLRLTISNRVHSIFGDLKKGKRKS